ncbi:hypothetical protein GNF10_24220 [Nostoc sp. UCD121]|uniref:hypothetical protein n=1 Tax=unclassified Nostoc TaxID=2593658 RepID=UPI0016285D66|nr:MULTISPECIES: hypothetical protein [unclassified Nostoc]MBC1218592.1 hypothetical protein [Nostoc sp. UCD120]MBC1278985.1 hypothetical protein [Nostoc sp. UCD121]MBC1294829.1 hypothetical protein [Nostoc sp. UCD122]
MTERKTKKAIFNGMSYRDTQRVNSKNRNKLKQEDIHWLKAEGYKNVGWNNAISLYHKIKEFLDKYQFDELTLEELFLEADRIGNKYFTAQEIQESNQRLAKEVNEIAEEIDKQFPDTEIEFIDFGNKTKKTYRKQNNQKSYRTVKY